MSRNKLLNDKQIRKYHRMFAARRNKNRWSETMALKFVIESVMQKAYHNGFIAGKKHNDEAEYQRSLDEEY
jgi:hypothetical protein